MGLSFRSGFKSVFYGLVVFFFLLFVLIPPIYLVFYLLRDIDMLSLVLGNSSIMGKFYSSVKLSYEIAFAVSAIDFLSALPMAWILLKRDFRFKGLWDTVLDLPMAMPTSALGFSVAMFWNGIADLRSAFWIVVALHVAMSYPYMLRTLYAAISSVESQYVLAARTLGAKPFTVARTIVLPMIKPGIVAGIILCFSKSLSETGGTFAALSIIGSASRTGPVLIKDWRAAGSDLYTFAGGLLSLFLIVSSLILLLGFRFLAMRWRIPIRKIYRFEDRVSSGYSVVLRDVASFLFAFITVLAPSLFIAGFPAWLGVSGIERDLLTAIASSVVVAGLTTVINLASGLPLSILISRSRFRLISMVIDGLVNIPLIVPTTALGFSIALFWSEGLAFRLPDLALISLAHISFTQPLLVRNVVASLEQLDPSVEETARTLGATPLMVFRRITFPLIKPGIIAGVILSFTRSLGETGATLAVVPRALTAPVYIVDLVKAGNYQAAGTSCIVLLAVSALLLYMLKRGVYAQSGT